MGVHISSASHHSISYPSCPSSSFNIASAGKTRRQKEYRMVARWPAKIESGMVFCKGWFMRTAF